LPDGDDIVTSDPGDFRALAEAAGVHVDARVASHPSTARASLRTI
jgi:hypothetical protein